MSNPLNRVDISQLKRAYARQRSALDEIDKAERAGIPQPEARAEIEAFMKIAEGILREYARQEPEESQ